MKPGEAIDDAGIRCADIGRRILPIRLCAWWRVPKGLPARAVLSCRVAAVPLPLTARLALAGFVALAGGALPAWTAERTLMHCAKLTAIDGDTVRCDGVAMRDMGDGAPFVSGYDSPEIRQNRCAAELALGRKAKKRMATLLQTKGVKIYDSGEVDAGWKRSLVWVMLPDGRSVGSVMIAEGLARRWTPDYRSDWCSEG